MTLKAVFKYTIGNKTEHFELSTGQTFTLGRSSKSDLKIDDEKLSSIHCSFTLKDESLEILDHTSKNGLYLNRMRIDSSEMFIGDELRIGSTKIIFDTNRMDDFSKGILTFTGASKDRAYQDLKMDFSGARIQNQLQQSNPQMESQVREAAIRKKANTPIRLSKQQIKTQNKLRSFLASLLDICLIIYAITVPIFLFNYLIESGGMYLPGISMEVVDLQEKRGTFIAIVEVILISLIFVLNFKILKFSLGEKIAGIERKYLSQ